MPIVLVALVVGLVAAAAAGIYYWRTPIADRPTTDGKPLIVLGLVFVVWGTVSVFTEGSIFWGWAPVGIVFLAVGLRQKKRHRQGQGQP